MDRTPSNTANERLRSTRSGSRGRGRLRSNRFLAPQELAGADRRRLWGQQEIYAEGHWPAIRVGLERQGWSTRQIELVHDQLRQGWPLDLAKEQVGILTGNCPVHSHRAG
jgi:hypothetical protein